MNCDNKERALVAESFQPAPVIVGTARLQRQIEELSPRQLVAGSTSNLVAGNASYFAEPCPATPEHIASYYDVVSTSQYPRIALPACAAFTCVQNNTYPTRPSSWPRHQLF